MAPAMGWVTGLAIYATIWWVVIFAVLPWGIRTPDKVEIGHASGAPENPRIVLKALVTTAISAVIWLAIELVVRSDWISFRAMAERG
jgi:predicted secreted protein